MKRLNAIHADIKIKRRTKLLNGSKKWAVTESRNDFFSGAKCGEGERARDEIELSFISAVRGLVEIQAGGKDHSLQVKHAAWRPAAPTSETFKKRSITCGKLGVESRLNAL